MAGGLFNRVKNFVAGAVVRASEVNTELNNIIANLKPEQFDDYSLNAAQMKTTTDPGTTDSESLATSTAGEFERIRFVLKRIIDKTNWYDVPDSTLAVGAPDVLAGYLGFDSKEGLAGGTDAAYSQLIRQGAIINPRTESNATVIPADFDGTNKKFGNYSLKTGATTTDKAVGFPGKYTNPYLGTLSLHFRNLFADDYIAYNALLGVELYLDSSGYLVTKITGADTTGQVKKTMTVTGADSRAGNPAWQHAAMKWRVAGQAGSGTDLLELELDNVDEGSQLADQTLLLNPGNGGQWVFGTKPNDPTWSVDYAANDLPDGVTDAWSANGTNGGNSASNGTMSFSTTGAAANYYSRTDFIDSDDMSVEFKMRLNVDLYTHDEEANVWQHGFRVQDTSTADVFGMNFKIGKIEMSINTTGASDTRSVNIDTSQFHVYRVYFNNGSYTLYIDGQSVGTVGLGGTGAPGADEIAFGDFSATADENVVSEWEYFRYAADKQVPLADNAADGNLDDIVFTKNNLSDGILASLNGTVPADEVFGLSAEHGITLPDFSVQRSAPTNCPATEWKAATGNALYFASDGKTRLAVGYTIPSEGVSAGPHRVKTGLRFNDHEGYFGSGLSGIHAASEIYHTTTGERQTHSNSYNATFPAGLIELRVYHTLLTGTTNTAQVGDVGSTDNDTSYWVRKA